MKQLFFSLLAVTLLTACKESESELLATLPAPDYSAPILPSSGIEATTQSRALTGDAFPSSTRDVFRVMGYSGAEAPTADWSQPYFSATTVDTDASGTLSLSTPRYYPADEARKVYFYACSSPGLSSMTANQLSPTAQYTIDGAQDILWAKVDKGIAKSTLTQEQPEFQFAHKLMQVKFQVVGDATFQTTLINLMNITIKGVKTSADLNLHTGILTFGGAADGVLTAYSGGGSDYIPTPPSSALSVGDPVMFEPCSSFKVSVSIRYDVYIDGPVTINYTYPDIAVTLSGGTNPGQAGTSHVVTLNFKSSEIVPTTQITQWIPGDDAGVDLM